MKDTPNNNSQSAAAGADNTEPDMMKIAMEADAKAENLGTTSPAAAAPAAPAATPTDKPADNAPAATEGKPDAKSGSGDKPGEAKPGDKPADKPGEQKESSAFDKARKERERQENLLKDFQKEKEAFRAEKTQFQTELTNLRREVTELRQRAAAVEPVKDKHGLTANDYDDLAAEYRAKGNTEMEAAAKARAAELRQQQPAAAAAAPATEVFRTPEFQRDWQKNVQELITANPDLGKPDNPVVRAANVLVNDENYGRFFRSHPDGIKAAVEVAQLMQRAESAKTLQTELDATKANLTKATAEIDRLNKLLQPNGSPPAGPAPSEKKPEEMSGDDIMAIARRADAGAT